MSISQENKQILIGKYGHNKADTGSVEVQCAILTERIRSLTGHLKDNHKDHQARRGLLILVAKRRKLLRYLERNSVNRYKDLIKKLEIRK